jgi:hypothetical protein
MCFGARGGVTRLPAAVPAQPLTGGVGGEQLGTGGAGAGEHTVLSFFTGFVLAQGVVRAGPSDDQERLPLSGYDR